MTERVYAEGSIWSIADTLGHDPVELSRKINATKVTEIAPDTWKIYFPPGVTPTQSEMTRRAESLARIMLLASPPKVVKVTPMWTEDLTVESDNAMMDIQHNGGSKNE